MMRLHLDRWIMMLLVAGCAEAKFAGNTPQRAQQKLEPSELCTTAGTDCTPPPPPVEPACSEVAVGADLAFLIDNSSSNEITDCPNPRATGRVKPNGAAIFRCEAETNREKAVIAAYDLLDRAAAGNPDALEARSRLSVVSFPVQDNAGFREQLPWTETAGKERAGVVSALQFTRAPWGKTPYGEGFKGVGRLFDAPSASDRQKVVILVTDGFPTDTNPAAVMEQVSALRQDGIKVLTIRVTGADSRAQRQAEHRLMLAGFDAASRREQGRNWYDAQEYSSFDAYLGAILSLGEQVAAGEVVEVYDSNALSKAVLGVIGKALKCKP